ncbi:tyrosine-type recombinase/integrase [Methylobacterium brachythecii]|uniref:Integrase n=1 Tax=Methylobacterium brachythecii TaxID=1176177 RepID=A0A7W6AEQ3_9HYPH|nr:site-specific integrase [Methylobacterium brachythecii]MBB3901348.1 integrase [Methylobacterium brachythecii]GLS42922.1 integrase [Methylobacterium brachythecii]
MARRASPENVIRLNKTAVANLGLHPGQSERVVWDADLPGFGIRLRASGNRSWVIRPPRGHGNSKLHTIGSVDLIDATTARETAKIRLAEAALGGDPTTARKEARAKAAVTMGGLLDRYVAAKIDAGRRPSTIGNMRHHLKVHWATLHDRPLGSITRAEIAERHKVVAEKYGRQAADRALSILGTFFGWSMREGLLEANPAANVNKATVATKRERVLSEAEVAAIWHACREDDFGRIVRLLMLTGQRREEVAAMLWSELNFQTATWSIPIGRMKNRRAHEVPLSRPAMEILANAPAREGRDFVFGDGKGPFSGYSKAKASLDKRAGIAVSAWRLHDLRRTATTGMNEIGIQPHIADAVLSHVSTFKAGVAGIYNRATYAEQKRAALDSWADHILGVTTRSRNPQTEVETS